ncbi:hypothetical protein NC653_026650 [Populus alba x Populus x berolinensis]|uniref:Uncharacterized protein n=1 Tax=Populus alba x Populus x berolinensis TaxID=444605 RepID=A0AAD6MEK3_9ROSI|nr:hypothetical protein NC653_026650 [Populus alba x Populus x berolinensis]
MTDKQKEKARVSRTSLILWQAHQNDAAAVRKLLEEDPSLVRAMDYDSRTPLHVASLHGWVDVAKCLIDFGADVNAQDRWKNTPLADAEGAKKHNMIETAKIIRWLVHNGSFGEILKASWRGTPVAVKRILPSLSDDRLVISSFWEAVTDRKPLMLITEYLRGGDLHQYLKEKGALSPYNSHKLWRWTLPGYCGPDLRQETCEFKDLYF